jgi:hypothetical protein
MNTILVPGAGEREATMMLPREPFQFSKLFF